MGYGTKIKMEMNDCTFLYGGIDGICPYHTKSCSKPCEKYAQIGDVSSQIFHDWNGGANKLAIELREKYFGTTEKLIGSNTVNKSKEEEEIEDFLGD